MSDALLQDLPRTLPAFAERFGTDAQCRAYLVRALWFEGSLRRLRASRG